MKVSSDIYGRYIEALAHRYRYSNCYFQLDEFKEWIDEGLVQGFDIDKGLILTLNQMGFVKLYFMGDDFSWTDEIDNLKQRFECLELVSEIVSRDEPGEYELGKYTQYKDRIQYNRLRSKGMNTDIKDGIDPIYCRPSDLIFLRQMMDETFDPIGDHIPSDNELGRSISNHSVICEREGGRISGFIIFEDKGKTSYIRMICVDKDLRGKRIGERLMKRYFALHQQFKGFTLWCRSDNTPALMLYSKMGEYLDENLRNFVYIL